MFRPKNPNFFKLKFKFSKKSVKFILGLTQKWMTIKDISQKLQLIQVQQYNIMKIGSKIKKSVYR